MKETKCPLCREKKKTVYCIARDNQNHDNEFNEFIIAECIGCGFLYLNPVPQPDEIALFYPKYYWIGEKRKFIEKISPSLFSASYEKAKYVTKYKKQGSILDVGCAEGFFLKHMKMQGWDVTGIDFSEQAISYGKKHLGLELYVGEVVKLERKIKRKFDVITLWATLEHVYDPLETVEAAKKLLTEDGILIYAVPNMGSIQAKIFGKYWLHLDVPRHLCFFTPETARLLCDKTGLTIKEMSYQSIEHNPGGWIYSFLYCLRDIKRKIKGQGRKEQDSCNHDSDQSDIVNDKQKETAPLSIPKKIFYWFVDNGMVMLFVPITRIEALLKRGGTITVIAEKKRNM
jgi:2-polyprenyl-3-methyl-5-hydroxy-6-metoxy-1,4-benzoquinol methylase